MRDNPELWEYMAPGPFSSAEDLTTKLFENKIDNVPGNFLYAMLVKPQPGGTGEEQLAGIVGYHDSSVPNAMTEIGWVRLVLSYHVCFHGSWLQIVVLPPYQRTFVATNAVGLLLLYSLDPPSEGGLGLRRVQWQAHSENKPSIRLARRMLMTYEGTIRWQRTLPAGKIGNGVDVQRLKEAERYVGEGQGQRPGRHSAMLSMCWDDWLVDGKRELVLEMMGRRK